MTETVTRPPCAECGGAMHRRGYTMRGALREVRYACARCKRYLRVADDARRGAKRPEVREQLDRLLRQGSSVRSIAKACGLSRTAVRARRARLGLA
jgi:transposase-like protein